MGRSVLVRGEDELMGTALIMVGCLLALTYIFYLIVNDDDERRW